MLPIIASASQVLSQIPPCSSPPPCPQSDKIPPHAQDAWWRSRDTSVGGASRVDGGWGGQDMLGWVSGGWRTWENPYTTLLVATHNTGLNISETWLGMNHRFFTMWSQIDTIPFLPPDVNMLCLCEGQSPLCTDRHVQCTLAGMPVSSLATHSPPHSPSAGV